MSIKYFQNVICRLASDVFPASARIIRTNMASGEIASTPKNMIVMPLNR